MLGAAVVADKDILKVLNLKIPEGHRNFGASDFYLIYYDKSRKTEAHYLVFSRDGRSIRDKPIKAGETSVTVMNPYLVPGELLAVTINSNGKEKITLDLPAGWIGQIPEKVSGTQTYYIQAPANAGVRTYEMGFQSGEKRAALKVHVTEQRSPEPDAIGIYPLNWTR